MSEPSQQHPIDQALRELPLQHAPEDCWQQIAANMEQSNQVSTGWRRWGAMAASLAAVGLAFVLWQGHAPSVSNNAQPTVANGFQVAEPGDELLANYARSTYSTDQALEEVAILSWIQQIDENRHYGDLRQQVSLQRQRDHLSTQLLEANLQLPSSGVWL
ncbi:hypothetical protein KFE80_10495 [bacterium SCSIO 12696]|nr:hypothetical protein KFE80_10495 [bacterium SCSIO 12696]